MAARPVGVRMSALFTTQCGILRKRCSMKCRRIICGANRGKVSRKEVLMSSRTISYISPEEYLKRERQAEYKSEYLNGEIFAMTGASRKHNLIGTNLVVSFAQQLRGKTCEVYPGEMRVKVRTTGL